MKLISFLEINAMSLTTCVHIVRFSGVKLVHEARFTMNEFRIAKSKESIFEFFKKFNINLSDIVRYWEIGPDYSLFIILK